MAVVQSSNPPQILIHLEDQPSSRRPHDITHSLSFLLGNGKKSKMFDFQETAGAVSKLFLFNFFLRENKLF